MCYTINKKLPLQKTVYYVLVFILSFMMEFTFGQDINEKEQNQLDSLNSIINNEESHDTTLANAYLQVTNILYPSNFDTIIPLCEKIKEIVKKGLISNHSLPITQCLLRIWGLSATAEGYSYYRQGNMEQSLKCYSRSAAIFLKINSKKDLATSINDIGSWYQEVGVFKKALTYYNMSLVLSEQLSYQKGIAMNLNNIGLIYATHGKYKKALIYYNKTLKIQKKTDEVLGTAATLNNIGYIYEAE